MTSPPLNYDERLSNHSDLARRYRSIQRMVVDYAIGLTLLGLNPFSLTLTLVVALAILLKMVWDIAKRWHFPIVRNPLAWAGGIMNGLGALAIALFAWLILIFLGTFIPLIDRFAVAVALMSGTWTLGAAANQFFFNGFLNRIVSRGSETTDG
ncbi:MAG: hypothetical protein HC838_05365 [Spirulinaceae cyanobacterium RM2_2_10]|nr:hypothetical protein [Spirulinaceae cyanobacterium SM2_1_0]NJO19595.1 hypothetical protein [Spirulinaceae cyanobacterium RM2_2_10]